MQLQAKDCQGPTATTRCWKRQEKILLGLRGSTTLLVPSFQIPNLRNSDRAHLCRFRQPSSRRSVTAAQGHWYSKSPHLCRSPLSHWLIESDGASPHKTAVNFNNILLNVQCLFLEQRLSLRSVALIVIWMDFGGYCPRVLSILKNLIYFIVLILGKKRKEETEKEKKKH